MATVVLDIDDELDGYESDVQDAQGEEYNAEQEAALYSFAQEFHCDVKSLARQYMEVFFKDKMLHCGGKITRTLLFSERRISMVMNYDISRGVIRAHKALEPTLSPEENEQAKLTGEVTSDIRLVLNVLDLLSHSGVPQQFAGGMMCLYLEFVEGINIGTEP